MLCEELQVTHIPTSKIWNAVNTLSPLFCLIELCTHDIRIKGMQDIQDQVLTQDFCVGLPKVVRHIFKGTFDFDDPAEITPNFLPGPLPCSSSVFLTS